MFHEACCEQICYSIFFNFPNSRPLVQEKLVLELEAMDKIKKAQVETNQELMTTKQRQEKTEQKSTEAITKAETERGHIRKELDTVRDNLTTIR